MGRAGDALRQVLEAYKISQNKLATALEVERSVVNRWFHGQVDPNGETIVSIVQTLKTLNPAAAERFIQLYLGELMRDPAVPICLRPTQPADLDYVLAAEQHPDNRAFVFQWSRQQHQNAIDSADLAHLIVELAGSERDQPQPVGYVILEGLLDPNQAIALRRIVITTKARGYGKATLELVKRLAFETYGVQRLWLDVVVGNDRAEAVYRAAGFTVEGTLRDCWKTERGYESLIVMSLLRSEYQP